MDKRPHLPPLDAWARAILFLGCRDAVRTRLVSHTMSGAFDRACWIGPATAATLPSLCYFPFADPRFKRFAERVYRSLHRSPCDDGTVPLWMRYVRRDVVLAVLASGGCAAACGGLASGPFLLGTDDARSDDNLALRLAARNGHVAVLDRLAAPPYLLGTEDARSGNNYALRWAAFYGHVAVLDRLAAPPYSLGTEDARSDDNCALQWAAANGHVAVLDRLAAPPYSLGTEDARSVDNRALQLAAANGHVAVLDRLAAPHYSLDTEDARSVDNRALRWAAYYGHVAVLDRLAARPYSLGSEDARSDDNCALRWAADNGRVAVLDRLAVPPYSLGTDAARSKDNYALRYAARNGHLAVLDRLAAPPTRLVPKTREATTTSHRAGQPTTGTSPSLTYYRSRPTHVRSASKRVFSIFCDGQTATLTARRLGWGHSLPWLQGRGPDSACFAHHERRLRPRVPNRPGHGGHTAIPRSLLLR